MKKYLHQLINITFFPTEILKIKLDVSLFLRFMIWFQKMITSIP
ncbi:MAG: hypothetical protein Satyrvirus19_14 [Satyrvirus sp.]|uniref:Uncharacterized protein n=1 Tax=Satyrvirus sp. TaxID=2487771 RepID=A0A3G5AE74_9VIRU|nr:MAG: hypothetical protein Satyrvirus19_14 [Satyrvirus sp.]